jgi:acetoacetate decarboxylase
LNIGDEKEMKTDPTKLYQMPHIMGPHWDKESLPKIQYPQTETVALQYRTKKNAAGELLPDSYIVDEEPIVTVVFAYHNGLHFLAGNGYNLATFQISARFDGAEDQIEGDYISIMFENQTWPILGGREFLGVPKLYADIPPMKIMPNGIIRCEASLWGHMLFGIELQPMKKQNPVVKFVASKRINSRPWLAYKYIPSLDGPPDADYPTITRNDIKINDLWMGNQGSVFFGSATKEDIGLIVNIIDALRTLPIVNIEQVLHFKGSAVLRFDQSRRLK